MLGSKMDIMRHSCNYQLSDQMHNELMFRCLAINDTIDHTSYFNVLKLQLV